MSQRSRRNLEDRRAWNKLNDSMGYQGRYGSNLEDKLNLEDPHLAQAAIDTWKYRLVGNTDDPVIGFLGEALATSVYLYMKYWKKYGNLALIWESGSRSMQIETMKLFSVLSRIISNLVIALKIYTNEPIDFQIFEKFITKKKRAGGFNE